MTENKTAVDFLAYDLINLDIAYEMGLEKNKFHKLRQEIIKKAKEMEKQQILSAAYHGANYESSPYKDAEDYYNKTYKSE